MEIHNTDTFRLATVSELKKSCGRNDKRKI